MKKSAGFTLIELLITVSIMATLTGFVAMNVFGSLAKARDAKRKSDLREIKTSLNLYYSIKGLFPPADGPGWSAPNMFDKTSVIKGCGTAISASNCSWGGSWVQDGITYMGILPEDPKATQGYFYMRDPGGRLSYLLVANMERSIDVDILKSQESCTPTNPVTGAPLLTFQSTWFVVCDSK